MTWRAVCAKSSWYSPHHSNLRLLAIHLHIPELQRISELWHVLKINFNSHYCIYCTCHCITCVAQPIEAILTDVSQFSYFYCKYILNSIKFLVWVASVKELIWHLTTRLKTAMQHLYKHTFYLKHKYVKQSNITGNKNL